MIQQTLFNFTSGNYYAIVGVNWSAGTVSTDDMSIKIKMNNNIIYDQYMDQGFTADLATASSLPLLIPPYTKMIFAVKIETGSTTKPWTCALVGRIYRTRD